MPYTEKLNDLHGRPMINVVSGATFYIYDEVSSTSPKCPGWLSLRTMEDEINHLLAKTDNKFCTPTEADAVPIALDCSCVDNSLQASFITWAKKHPHAGWVGPICR